MTATVTPATCPQLPDQVFVYPAEAKHKHQRLLIHHRDVEEWPILERYHRYITAAMDGDKRALRRLCITLQDDRATLEAVYRRSRSRDLTQRHRTLNTIRCLSALETLYRPRSPGTLAAILPARNAYERRLRPGALGGRRIPMRSDYIPHLLAVDEHRRYLVQLAQLYVDSGYFDRAVSASSSSSSSSSSTSTSTLPALSTVTPVATDEKSKAEEEEEEEVCDSSFGSSMDVDVSMDTPNTMEDEELLFQRYFNEAAYEAAYST